MSTPDQNQTKANIPTIVGAVVGVIVVLAAIAVIVFYVRIRGRNVSAPSTPPDVESQPTGHPVVVGERTIGYPILQEQMSASPRSLKSVDLSSRRQSTESASTGRTSRESGRTESQMIGNSEDLGVRRQSTESASTWRGSRESVRTQSRTIGNSVDPSSRRQSMERVSTWMGSGESGRTESQMIGNSVDPSYGRQSTESVRTESQMIGSPGMGNNLINNHAMGNRMVESPIVPQQMMGSPGAESYKSASWRTESPMLESQNYANPYAAYDAAYAEYAQGPDPYDFIRAREKEEELRRRFPRESFYPEDLKNGGVDHGVYSEDPPPPVPSLRVPGSDAGRSSPPLNNRPITQWFGKNETGEIQSAMPVPQGSRGERSLTGSARKPLPLSPTTEQKTEKHRMTIGTETLISNISNDSPFDGTEVEIVPPNRG